MICPMITHERLKELVTYDPATGDFRWRVTRHSAVAGRTVGHTDVRGYVTLRIEYRKYYAHRLAWLYMTGECPKDIDHINMDKSDNRFGNLRLADRRQNMVNTPLRRDNQTGFKGVSVLPGGRYRAVVHVNGAPKHVGVFDTAEEAAEARHAAASALYGEFYRPG